MNIFQHSKLSKTLKRLITRTQSKEDKKEQREARKKRHHLHHIRSHTLLIRKNLVKFSNYIEKYNDHPVPRNWQIVRTSSDRIIRQTQELGESIAIHFTNIIELIEDRALAYTFWGSNIHYTLYLFNEALRINPEYDMGRFRELREGIIDQIKKLDETLSSIDKEMPKEDYC